MKNEKFCMVNLLFLGTDKMQVKKFDSPDETRSMPKTKIEVVKIAEATLMRATFEPGWKWSECVKPTVGTSSCQVPHINYVVSGKMMVKMDDGTEKEMNPGDAAVIPPGHDAWVVGDENCVIIDFSGGNIYGKKVS